MTEYEKNHNCFYVVHCQHEFKRYSTMPINLICAILISLCGQLPAQASDVLKTIPDVCDREWDRIKGIPPIRKAELDRILRAPEKVEAVTLYTGEVIPINIHKPSQGQADLYYLLARVPFVIGAEEFPTEAQRDEWLENAANLGHVSAKAALLRLRYLGKEVAAEKRPTRKEYLMAARDAGEAGDPEFAAVLMDTAQDKNAAFHCRLEDRNKSPAANGCNPQDVVKPIETRKWAEAAALGGHPNAKNLLCTMHSLGTFPQLSFEKNDALAYQWCFASHYTACSTGSHSGLLIRINKTGIEFKADQERAADLEKRSPLPRYLRKYQYFPQIAR